MLNYTRTAASTRRYSGIFRRFALPPLAQPAAPAITWFFFSAASEAIPERNAAPPSAPTRWVNSPQGLHRLLIDFLMSRTAREDTRLTAPNSRNGAKFARIKSPEYRRIALPSFRPAKTFVNRSVSAKTIRVKIMFCVFFVLSSFRPVWASFGLK
jgi:hypothetical protein